MPQTVSGENYREFSEPRFYECESIAQVRQIRNPVSKSHAIVGSGSAALIYKFDSSLATADDGLDVIQVNNTQVTGRFSRIKVDGGAVLNLKWFGAVGDGVTNDRVAINTAFSTAGTTNIPLYAPAGTYLVTGGNLNVPSGLTLYGDTVNTIFTGGGAVQKLFNLDEVSDTTLRSFKISGGCINGIYIYGSENILLEDLYISGCTVARGLSGLFTNGIGVKESDYVTIQRCKLVGNGRSDEISGSIYFYDSATDCRYCVIQNNYIENAGFHAINVYDTSYCKVLNNYVNQGNIGTNAYNNGYGILCYDGQHDTLHNMCIGNVISGNTVENCYGIGIYLVVTKDCVVSNNVLKNVCLQQDSPTLHNSGININEGIRTIVTGNTIDGVGGAQTNNISGIGILAGTEVVVSDNHINDVTTGSLYSYGIYIGGQGEVFTDSGRGVIVKGNTIRTCDSDGIRAEGNLKTECVITGNIIEEVKRHGIAVQWFQRGIISNNTVLNFGGGLSGIVVTNIGGNSQRNLIQGNMVNAVAAPVSNYGSSRCYYLDTPGPNWVLNNTAYSSPTLGIGYYDPNATGGNIYEGNQVTGTITTPYNLTAPGVCSFSGTDTPEGAVAAAIGSIYRRTNGGASTSLYVKESGTGNTGWVAK